MTTISYTIPNISCGHCLNTITTELGELKGVSSIDGNVMDKSITITYEPPANEERLKNLLKEINYPVE